MKGTFFSKPLEFQILIEGESWRQGDAVSGTLTVKNHGAEPITTQGVEVKFAYGKLKKVREKQSDAFEVLKTVGFDKNQTISQASSAVMNWRFETDRNAKVTDTLSSLFIVYGIGSECEKLGQLQLKFEPSALVQEFLKILQIRLRFVQKSMRATKGGVEVKLAPPDGKAFSNLELLAIHFQFEGENLEVNYKFEVKKLEATAVSMTMKKEKQECSQVFTQAQYLTPSGRFNDEALEQSIREALALVARG